jgi:plasmid stabilization system protein ParE
MLRLHRAAEVELFRAADYYDDERPGLGGEFLEVVQTAFDSIAASPTRWPFVDARHRRRVLKRFPFSIFYRVVGPDVVVIAIAHHKLRPDYWTFR